MKKSAIIRLLPAYICILGMLIFIAYMGSHAVSVFRNSQIIEPERIVVIDAGHGGIDGGATSCSGVKESQLNLEISLRLNDLFHLIGISTVMIRSEDVSVYTSGETIAAKKVSDLKNRVKMVNSMPECLLISIHQNYFGDSKYDGAQVFYGRNPESQKFAESMQSALISALDPDNARKPKKANGVYLMENINASGILVECGFLSNPEEDLKLQDPVYQKKLAAVIAAVTSEYIYENPIA